MKECKSFEHSDSLGKLLTMMNLAVETSVVLILLLFVTAFHSSVGMDSRKKEAHCNEKDRVPLLIFKQGIVDLTNHLSTWSHEKDCCAWEGVQCDNHGRVTKLDLKSEFLMLSEPLQGDINLSLLELECLKYLDLSGNFFQRISIPNHDRHKLENQSLVTPHSRTNFSMLQYLDLSNNMVLHIDNLHWLSRLSSLKHLDLADVDLHMETNWLQIIGLLPSLSELSLRNCNLTYINPFHKNINFSSLVTVDLSINNFHCELPNWLFNLSTDLSTLDLAYNEGLHIDNLHWLSPLSSLKHLDLTNIDLHMETNWLLSIASLPSLSELILANCQLTYINPFLKNVNFSSLVTLDLSHNHFHSELPNWLFNLSTHLSTLDLGYNNFSGQIPDWSNYRSLFWLDLPSNKLNGSIPDWLGQLEELQRLDLFSNLFHGCIPSTLGNISSLTHLDISFNCLSGNVSEIIGEQFDFLGLSHNSFSGDLSNTLLKSTFTLMASNDFKGRLPHMSENVAFLDLAHNSLSGPLSPLLCQSTVVATNAPNQLKYLDVSYNLLTGELPDCWMNWGMVFCIFLASNRLVGEVPPTLGSLANLHSLDLHNNSLFGDITSLLQNCTGLTFLNLGKNNFSGSISNNIMMQSLEVIKLRSNQFDGYIPTQLCQLPSLIVLDLADNKLSGLIPQCLYNITSMVSGLANHAPIRDIDYTYGAGGQIIYKYKIMLNTKGQQLEYLKNLVFVRTIDFSANNLFGEILSELFSLIQLQTLNLSQNHLTGKIPEKIGEMKYVESLDLSNNKLSGEIPQSMSTLSFLSYLNLSFNNFTGQIPLGTQLQGFDAWSYMGNPKLCGPPLTKNCTKGKDPEKPKLNGGNEDDSMTESLYIGMGVGFAVSFWGVCGSLFLNRAWRHAYFRFLNRVADKLYVFVILKFNSFRQI